MVWRKGKGETKGAESSEWVGGGSSLLGAGTSSGVGGRRASRFTAGRSALPPSRPPLLLHHSDSMEDVSQDELQEFGQAFKVPLRLKLAEGVP